MLQLALMLIAALSIVMTTPLSTAKATSTAEENREETPDSGIGAPAPDFSGVDVDGRTRKLSDFRGKTVVLEWTNHECPFVRKLYDTDTMQNLQKEATSKGIVWLTISSSAEGKQGFTRPEEAKSVMARENSHETARILDSDGMIGKLYGATNTPQMFVINGEGTLVYAGAIDDKPSVSHSTVRDANNYVKAALDDLSAGRAVKISTSKPYGCGIKY
jgi:peroxiredoxin